MSMQTETPARARRLIVLLPLLIFLGLAGLFLTQLLSGRDTSE
ncbi:MAG: DsbE family thiol:disulfide interchange protein, partial [Mesorhizobium sp.]